MEFSQNILPFITAIVTVPLSSWLTAVLMRKKYTAEVDQLRAQITATQTNTKGDELSNVREGISILMSEIVEPLKKELNAVRRELTRFRRALEKSKDCKHYDMCPVRFELQNFENCNIQPPDHRHSDRTRDHP